MSRLAILLCVAAAAGCAEATFSAHARDNSVEDIKRALAASRPGGLAQDRHMAFLVTAGGPADKALIGYDLSAGKIVWEMKADVRSRVVAGPGLITHRQGERELVARDPKTGRPAFTIALGEGERYVGAALDDERLYYVVQATGGAQRTSLTIAVDRTGKELWRVPAQGSIGAPAARGGVVAVPYHYQNVTLLDGKTGKELARVRNKDEQITYVRALPEGFFYGSSSGAGFYLLDEKSAAGTREGASYVRANLGGDHVRTFYWWDGYQLAQSDYSAFDRNRLLWRGTKRGDTLAFRDDLAILHSYRYIFALDAKAGTLRWAYAHPRVDLVAAEDVGTGVVFASVDGDLGTLDGKTGALGTVHKTGLRLAGVTFDAEGFRGEATAAQPGLLETLKQIVWDPDARFTAVKVFATDGIAGTPGLDATAALLEIVLAPRRVPPQVQKRAGEVLVKRKDTRAGGLFVEALKTRYDFVEEKEPRALDVLSRAVVAIDAKEAAPELAQHLLDPATPQAHLKELAAALAALGGPEAAAALREFVLTYRADPMFLAEPAALNVAAEGLLKIGGAEGARAVAFVANEARTLRPVAQYLQTVLKEPGPK